MTVETEFMGRVLKAAGRMVLEGSRSTEVKENVCGIFDVVTKSDVAVERFIIDAIRREFPDDEIVSEELNPDSNPGCRFWTIDPIDGTMNYSRGIPLFGVQMAVVENGSPIAAGIYLPVQDEMYLASSDGAFLNGRPIRTACPRPLRECFVSTGDFSRKSQHFRDAQAIIFSECYSDIARFKVFGASCVDYAYLSCGRTDVHVRFTNKIWDFMPGLYLAEAAGAVYDKKLQQETSILILCSSQEVLEEATEAILPRIISCFRRS